MNENYTWVMKVIESCENGFQITAAGKLIELFKQMYSTREAVELGNAEVLVDQMRRHLETKHCSLVAAMQ